MKSFIVLFAILGVAFAGHSSFQPYNVSAHTIFMNSDINHDYIFSRDELDKAFVIYDSDGDGRVSRHEYTIHLTQQIPEFHDFAHALYDDYDVTGDHHLDHKDYDMYYAKMDRDDPPYHHCLICMLYFIDIFQLSIGDGTVSETEFVDYWIDLFIRTEHLHGNNHGHGH